MNNDERSQMLKDVFVNGLRLLVFHPEKIMEDITSGVQHNAQSFVEKMDSALVTMRDYLQLKGCWPKSTEHKMPDSESPTNPKETPS